MNFLKFNATYSIRYIIKQFSDTSLQSQHQRNKSWDQSVAPIEKESTHQEQKKERYKHKSRAYAKEKRVTKFHSEERDHLHSHDIHAMWGSHWSVHRK